MTRITASGSIYHRSTSNCAGNRIQDGRCATCHEWATSVYEFERSQQIQVDTQDFELDPKIDPPWHKDHAMYTPKVKPLVPVWKQRQILRQQRPRDGLK